MTLRTIVVVSGSLGQPESNVAELTDAERAALSQARREREERERKEQEEQLARERAESLGTLESEREAEPRREGHSSVQDSQEVNRQVELVGPNDREGQDPIETNGADSEGRGLMSPGRKDGSQSQDEAVASSSSRNDEKEPMSASFHDGRVRRD